MCYYDQYKMACNCFKWGHFRQHCTREYRTGETCGMKLVMATYQMEEQCKVCTKIETKYNRIRKEQDRIKRWKKEDRHGRKASIAASEDTIAELEAEVNDLNIRKYEALTQLRWYVNQP
ncbi:hypothetical protein D0Z07_1961 [Hyphodiscus hymeniophilus]|uniref:Uncharacterized protein n=1 Tax=Hyphodiscus hymeniophilus TaxID=353542 RepID=A0A9P7B078_9HELO|nr:hypothetical protein D0Z07_1961 [Hyphodiscus hymeniophilus]